MTNPTPSKPPQTAPISTSTGATQSPPKDPQAQQPPTPKEPENEAKAPENTEANSTLAGTKPSSSIVAGKATLPKEPVVVQEPLADRIEKFAQSLVIAEKQPPASRFSHRGVCARCGWQSYQYDEQTARDVVAQHAIKHWSEVAHG